MWVPHPFLLLERVGIPKCRLRSLQDSFLHRLGQADADEVFGGIEVAFADSSMTEFACAPPGPVQHDKSSVAQARRDNRGS